MHRIVTVLFVAFVITPGTYAYAQVTTHIVSLDALVHKENTAIDWSKPAKTQIINGEKPSSKGNVGRAFAITWVAKSQFSYQQDPGCAGNMDAARENVANAIKGGAAMIGSFWGPWGTYVGTVIGSAIVAAGRASAGSDLHKLITEGYSRANCEILTVVIPGNAKILDVTYWANDIDDYTQTKERTAHEDVRWAKWEPYSPRKIVRDSDKMELTAVSAVFKNWSHNHPRLAGLIVAYEVPERKKP